MTKIETVRLIADDGKLLTNGEVTAKCIDVGPMDNADSYYEVDEPVEEAESADAPVEEVETPVEEVTETETTSDDTTPTEETETPVASDDESADSNPTD